jgi:hypothetical protein
MIVLKADCGMVMGCVDMATESREVVLSLLQCDSSMRDEVSGQKERIWGREQVVRLYDIKWKQGMGPHHCKVWGAPHLFSWGNAL